MNEHQEQLLWELGQQVPETSRADDGALDRENALAYREGRLPDAQAEIFERSLSRSSRARAQLTDLPPQVLADPAVREQVLATFAQASRRQAPRRQASRRQGSRTRTLRYQGMALAALVVAALGVGILLRSGSGSLPADLTYEVSVSGLAEIRDQAPSGSRVEAYADTLVEITAQPQRAIEDIEVGLYRENAGGRLERILPTGSVRLERVRGTVRVTARADDLVASGRLGHLYLIVARPGDLPTGGEPIADDAARRAVEASGRRQVHALELQLLTPDGSSSP
jgi:hypothetical protein